MSEIALSGKIRSERGKGPMRRLRSNGLVPAIIYGKGDPLSVSIDSKMMDGVLKKTRKKLIKLNIEDNKESKLVLLKEVQRHPLASKLVHVDFFEVAMDKKQQLPVPIKFVGVPKGVKLGGTLNFVHRYLEIQCLPVDIPEEIELDISGLDTGQSLHVDELKLKAGITPISDPREVLVSVVKPKEEKEETPGEETVETEAKDKKAEGEAAK